MRCSSKREGTYRIANGFEEEQTEETCDGAIPRKLGDQEAKQRTTKSVEG
jgi:hypothetical protein